MQKLLPADSPCRPNLMAFSRQYKCSTCTERVQCGPRIPGQANPLEPVNQRIESALSHFLQEPTMAERYAYLIRLADRNVRLFDKLVMYVLPVISIAIWATKPKRVTPELLIAAARTIGDQVGTAIPYEDSFFPPPSETFNLELRSAARIAQLIFDAGLASVSRPADTGVWLAEQASKPTILSQINRVSFNLFFRDDRLIGRGGLSSVMVPDFNQSPHKEPALFPSIHLP